MMQHTVGRVFLFFSFYDYIVEAYSKTYNGVRVVMKQHFGFNIT